jgi:dUTPase
MDTPEFFFALDEKLVDLTKDKSLFPLGASTFLPTRVHSNDTGWDVRCAIPGGLELTPGCYVLIPLGFRAFIPDGWWLDLRPRSSTFVKRQMVSLQGTIDEGYENQFAFAAKYDPDACKLLTSQNSRIEFGDKIGQLIPVRRETMIVTEKSNDELDFMFKNERHAQNVSVRGTGGFGSTSNFKS